MIQSKLCEQDREAVAYALYDAGFPHESSNNAGEITTAGYECDDYGNFVYPLLVDQDTYAVVPWTRVKLINAFMQKENDAPDFYKADLSKLEDGDFVRFNKTIYVKGTLPTLNGPTYFLNYEQTHCLCAGDPKLSSADLTLWEVVQKFRNATVKEL